MYGAKVRAVCKAVGKKPGGEPYETTIGFLEDAIRMLDRIRIPEKGIQLLFSRDYKGNEEELVMTAGDTKIYQFVYAVGIGDTEEEIRDLTEKETESAIEILRDGKL